MPTNKPEWQAPKPKKSVTQWLLDSDPSIRWQVMRDLTEEPDEFVAAERSRVASEGWRARLLDLHGPDGNWDGDIATPHWLSNLYTLLLLRDLGLDPTREYEKAKGVTAALTDARVRAQEYLLERRLFRRLSSGEVIEPKWTRFTFPTMWHYDVLRGLDYLRSAGVEPDERVAEAVGLVLERRQPDERWLFDEPHRDSVHDDLEGGVGQPSRWNTLRALRVLDWYSAQS